MHDSMPDQSTSTSSPRHGDELPDQNTSRSRHEDAVREATEKTYRVGCRFCGGWWEHPTAEAAQQFSAEHAGEELDRRIREYAESRAAGVVR
jgi:hypothetical protein